MNLVSLSITTFAPVVAAILVDVQAWAKARETNPSAPFSLSVALPRWLVGLLTGILAAMTALQVQP